MKNYEETARAVLSARDDYLAKQKKRRKAVLCGTSVIVPCLCLAVILTALGKNVLTKEKVTDAVSDSVTVAEKQAETVVEEKPQDSKEELALVLWADANSVSQAETEVSASMACLPAGINDSLQMILFTAQDTDLIGFILHTNVPSEEPKVFPEREALSAAANKLQAVSETVVSRLHETGMSRAEAQARKNDDADYLAAKQAYSDAKAAYYGVLLNAAADAVKPLLDRLADVGITLVASCENAEYQPYFSRYGGVAICYAAKNDIIAFLSAQNSEEMNVWTTAAQTPAVLKACSYDDEFADQVHLCPDSKLSVELAQDLELNGEAYADRTYYDVQVVFALDAKEYSREELHAAALREIGLTDAELAVCNDGDLIQRYLEYKRELSFHEQEYQALIDAYISPGDIIDNRAYSGCVLASLLRSQIEELEKSDDIAYIDFRHESQEQPIVTEAESEANLEAN